LLYFSGFSLQNEKELFKDYLKNSSYEVAGFSYGAIKAFEYALTPTKRIDTLTLLSPAFFQDKDKKFKRVQLISFKKDKQSYMKNFLKNISYPCTKGMDKYFREESIKELQELLNYTWEIEKLEKLQKKGTDIRIHLGASDKIIDAKKAYEFFKPFATVYYYKDKGHILCKP